MRQTNIVASLALIAILAAVAVPGPVGSRASDPPTTPDPELFTSVKVDGAVLGSVMTIKPLDPGARSDGNLDQRSTMIEPDRLPEPPQARPDAAQPAPARGSVSKNPWRVDPEISWYGPGFIGNRTACGLTLTRTLVGVAHRSLPCGTRITFRYKGTVLTMPVVDRGPYVAGRIFDLTYGACKKLNHCQTGPIEWRYAGR